MDPSIADSTGLYKEFLAERREILYHKWIESEKAGCDIGFEPALLDWTLKYQNTVRPCGKNDTASPLPPDVEGDTLFGGPSAFMASMLKPRLW
jgi:hypothetical protein